MIANVERSAGRSHWNNSDLLAHFHKLLLVWMRNVDKKIVIFHIIIESVDSICRDGADTPIKP